MSDVGEGALELLPCANMGLRMDTRSPNLGAVWGRFRGGSGAVQPEIALSWAMGAILCAIRKSCIAS
jgi:hypothetical protein